MANVKVIPPREKRPETLRVAAYCRVSSDSSDQLHSYATQIRNYTEEISKHDGWELVDIYADPGQSGTRMDKREDFSRMLADCRKGKIDKILVKSISRFARNTRDCLATLRELSSLGVSVQFEKENINTETLTTELMVSVSGSLAQEESISISKNQRMSYQRRMERGEFITCCAPFGYRLVDGKNLVIAEDEANIVRWIFDRYLDGYSTTWIADELTKRGRPSMLGNEKWQPRTIQKIITNEKYIGDTLCQKTYTTMTFPFIQKENHGEADQYYVENTHPAIISRETFDCAQSLRLRRGKRTQSEHPKYPLTLKMVCGKCGSVVSRRASKQGYVTWVCRKHDRRAADCSVGRIPEPEIYAAFIRMYNSLKLHEGILLKPVLAQLDALAANLQQGNPAMLAVNKAIAETSEQSYKVSVLQAKGLLDAEVCTEKLRDINARLTELRRERRQLLRNEDIEDVIDAVKRTVSTLQDGPETLPAFDETVCSDLVEKIIVEAQTRIRFRLYGGIELMEELRESRR